ncbi:hypothetical protein AA12717_3553 [Gluconacetobacter sacchari DSM 12717]|uniref:DUF4145 domain-containing protein n=2 Tax=Gluconacetobacter sacchari TaxID=92759 RepID=A0A7W4NQZ9_9PROT|nr:hypothetical protein [Gluconacetobacter sacchari]MBB2162912.1 hypothetical protein [Gluconacetobacter sacchari]GBQ30698.1 hypothetical protein AA12717_3553 [Gluconacetobacter sacchari DSM 12717]
MINAEERKGSFSHMARLVGNVLVSEALGLDLSNGPDDILRFRPLEDFNIILSEVIREAIDKKLGSQALKRDIDKFARDLISIPGLSGVIITPEPIENEELEEDDITKNNETQSNNDEKENNSDNNRPKPPKKPEHIKQEKTIYEGLKKLSSEKLESLYYSICIVSAKSHTPLIAVGIWSFIESLTASMGREETTPFKDFLNKHRLQKLGIGQGKALNAPISSISRIAEYGNLTKHHKVAAQFDYSQMINDMKVIEPLISACINEINNND